MKTTIEIPDPLFRRAKAAAATRGITLKQLMTEAVEQNLRAGRVAGPPAWKQLHGGLKSLRRETQRISHLIDQEFERLDEEDVE